MIRASAGWYPDRQREGYDRWFDGVRWTGAWRLRTARPERRRQRWLTRVLVAPRP